mgnify:CR=1 FL=1
MNMNEANPLVSELIYAFQDPRVVSLVKEITGLQSLIPDEFLYAGGVSAMEKGDYLNPHLDNSHGKEGQHYRVINLLYYVSPNWSSSNGGNLELWDHGLKQPCRTIACQFNRLVIMATHQTSWHSVSPINQILTNSQRRCCVNNYYFSPDPIGSDNYRHVTSFRGRPEQPLQNAVLTVDSFIRNRIPRNLKNLIRKPQYYQQKQER